MYIIKINSFQIYMFSIIYIYTSAIISSIFLLSPNTNIIILKELRNKQASDMAWSYFQRHFSNSKCSKDKKLKYIFGFYLIWARFILSSLMTNLNSNIEYTKFIYNEKNSNYVGILSNWLIRWPWLVTLLFDI